MQQALGFHRKAHIEGSHLLTIATRFALLTIASELVSREGRESKEKSNNPDGILVVAHLRPMDSNKRRRKGYLCSVWLDVSKSFCSE